MKSILTRIKKKGDLFEEVLDEKIAITNTSKLQNLLRV